MSNVFTKQFHGKTVVIESGKLAKQAKKEESQRRNE